MIVVIDRGAEDLLGMETAIAISHCGSRVTQYLNGIPDPAAAMLLDSASVMVRSDG